MISHNKVFIEFLGVIAIHDLSEPIDGAETYLKALSEQDCEIHIFSSTILDGKSYDNNPTIIHDWLIDNTNFEVFANNLYLPVYLQKCDLLISPYSFSFTGIFPSTVTISEKLTA